MVTMKKKTPKLLTDVALTRDNTGKYPWRFADNSIESCKIEKVLEYVPGKERGRFMDELYRVLACDGTAQVKIPYWSCASGVQDYLYEWPPWNDNSFSYFNKSIREKMGINGERNLKCDFDYTGGYELEMGTAQRSQEAREFAAKHYTNAILAVMVTLTKKARNEPQK